MYSLPPPHGWPVFWGEGLFPPLTQADWPVFWWEGVSKCREHGRELWQLDHVTIPGRSGAGPIM